MTAATLTTAPVPATTEGNHGLTAECPECCAEVSFDQTPILHEILPCADCGAELEVMAVDPLQVETAPEVEEDWGE